MHIYTYIHRNLYTHLHIYVYHIYIYIYIYIHRDIYSAVNFAGIYRLKYLVLPRVDCRNDVFHVCFNVCHVRGCHTTTYAHAGSLLTQPDMCGAAGGCRSQHGPLLGSFGNSAVHGDLAVRPLPNLASS